MTLATAAMATAAWAAWVVWTCKNLSSRRKAGSRAAPKLAPLRRGFFIRHSRAGGSQKLPHLLIVVPAGVAAPPAHREAHRIEHAIHFGGETFSRFHTATGIVDAF